MKRNFDNIRILSLRALKGKKYGLQVISTNPGEEDEMTLCTTTYYLLKLLKSLDEEQLYMVRECFSKIERSEFAEGEVYTFPRPVMLRPEISVKISSDTEAPLRSNINSLANRLTMTGISKRYVRRSERENNRGEAYPHERNVHSLLIKSYELYEDYKKEGFTDYFARKTCGLENDMLFTIAKQYFEEEQE